MSLGKLLFPPSLLTSMAGGAGKAAWGSAKFAMGGGIRRTVAGAGIGGMFGAATSDSNTSTGQLSDTVAGAAAGMGLGFLTTRLAGRTAMRGLQASLNAPGRLMGLRPRHIAGSPVAKMARAMGRGAKGVGSAGLGVAQWSIQNPRAAMLVGGGLLGAYAMSETGAQEADPAYQAQIARRSGGSTGRTGFVQSTHGLVQGLHQSRH